METKPQNPENQSVAPELSVSIPCYNEADVLPLLHARLKQELDALGISWEVVFVDDGSRDATFQQLAALNQADPRFKALALSRNFGHQAALCAGLSCVSGNFVAILDADLQDPPELLGRCLQTLREGNDVVYAVRRKRKESIFKRAAYAAFYRALRLVAEVDIPLDSGDFCVMRRNVVEVLRTLPERNIFLRGLRAWSGFRQVGMEYERQERAAGETKYPFRKLLRLATDGIFAFSSAPLRVATFIGFAGVAISILLAAFILTWRFAGFQFMGHTAHELPGWTAVVCLGLFLGSFQFLILGVLGEYIGRIYAEVKQRPRWIIRESLGLERRCDDLDRK
jgi:dolichol-phosphate mannosyltransferase